MLQWSAPVDAHIRITVLSTDHRGQYQLLDQIVSASAIYLELQADITTIDALQDALTEACQIQDSPDLTQTKYLVIMNCDRAAPAPLADFLRALLAQSEHLHIILSGRATCAADFDEDLAEQMRLFPADRSFASEQKLMRNTLEVRAFGTGQVTSQGKIIDDWKGDLTRNLFFFLLNKPIIRRDEISSAFWKTHTRQEGINLFHVTRLRLKNLLGMEMVDYGRGYYHLSGRIRLIYDVNDFLELIDRSHHTAEDEIVIPLLEAAVGLYRGSFINWLDDESASAIRARCEEEYCDALGRLACIRYRQGDLARASGLLARASRVKMGREDIVARLMETYLRLGQPVDALQAYRRLEGFISASTGGFRPGEELRRLSAQALANLPPAYFR